MILSSRQRTELSKENLKRLEEVFLRHLPNGKKEFTLVEFKQIVPSKNVSKIKRDASAAPESGCQFGRLLSLRPNRTAAAR